MKRHYGSAANALGLAGNGLDLESSFSSKILKQSNEGALQAAQALVHLHDLTTRVAIDVDQHNDRVEVINDTLTAAKNQEPQVVVEMVAKLMKANQELHEKLAAMESKLREQAQEMQTFAAEAQSPKGCSNRF